MCLPPWGCGGESASRLVFQVISVIFFSLSLRVAMSLTEAEVLYLLKHCDSYYYT